MPTTTEDDVLRMFLSRMDNYTVESIQAVCGRMYSVVMKGQHYRAVVLPASFDYYRLRYHIAMEKPTLVICYVHDSVLPIPVLSLRAGNFANAYELPEEVTDVEQQRKTKLGSQVLLGMYMSGMKAAQQLVNDLPMSTRNRYLRRVKLLGRRKRGKPVGRIATAKEAK